MLETAAAETIRTETSRKSESHYGVVISSTEHNKTTTRLRILFYPQGKVDTVEKNRLDFADAPADLNQADKRFLETYKSL